MRRSRVGILCLEWLLLLSCVAVGAAAQAPPSAVVVPSPAALDSLVAVQLAALQGTRLDFETAVELALERSTQAQQAAAELHAAEAVVRREKGEFDPAVFADGLRSHTELPAVTIFSNPEGDQTDELSGTVGADKRFALGTAVRASLLTRRVKDNSPIQRYQPRYESQGNITVVQPLLKGLGISTRGELTAAEFELQAAAANYAGVLEDVRSQVEETYWILFAAERDATVEKVIRDAAAALQESAERRAHAGLVGPNQVANARVFLANQEAARLDAWELLGSASDHLASLIGRRPDPGFERFRTTAEPPRTFDLAPQDTVVALAERNNQALRTIESRIEAERARERAAGRDAWPTLDLQGSLGSGGLGGDGRGSYLDFFSGDSAFVGDSSLDETWRQVFQGDFPTWSAGFAFRLPIGRRSGTGERDRRRALVRIAEQQLVAARRGLEETVRARHRELENANERLAFAKQGVDAAFESARIGRLEFENGRTTAFELVRLGGDLADAQRTYSRALVRAATAAAELRGLTAGAYPNPTP